MSEVSCLVTDPTDTKVTVNGFCNKFIEVFWERILLCSLGWPITCYLV